VLGLINDTGMIVLIVAVVLLFGASQIPKVARNIAEAGKEFRKAQAEMEAHPTDQPDKDSRAA
jgi:TatA/E family protein of Tat protein translocase